MTGPGAHRRKNLLTDDWVLVSPHRLSRPWQGAVSPPSPPQSGPAHDSTCYLCAGNTRSGGQRNPDYTGVHVFDNDFPALMAAASSVPQPADPHALLQSEVETGVCRVICYSPRHDLPMSQMSPAQIEPVVAAWCAQSEELLARSDIAAVTIFENRGEMMGASNPHPHGQIWATGSVPNELARETDRQHAWMARTGRPMLMDYLAQELSERVRILSESEHFVTLVPFWASWPFETLVLPRRAVGDLTELSAPERRDLAHAFAHLTSGYDRVFDAPFPYTMGWHQRPARGPGRDGFVLHAHVYPPLLRSATIRKFMVGFEMLGGPQRDLTPEDACSRLREACGRI